MNISENERIGLLVTAWWSLKLLDPQYRAAAYEFELKDAHGILIGGEPKSPRSGICTDPLDRAVLHWCECGGGAVGIYWDAWLKEHYGITLTRVESEPPNG